MCATTGKNKHERWLSKISVTSDAGSCAEIVRSRRSVTRKAYFIDRSARIVLYGRRTHAHGRYGRTGKRGVRNKCRQTHCVRARCCPESRSVQSHCASKIQCRPWIFERTIAFVFRVLSSLDRGGSECETSEKRRTGAGLERHELVRDPNSLEQSLDRASSTRDLTDRKLNINVVVYDR